MFVSKITKSKNPKGYCSSEATENGVKNVGWWLEVTLVNATLMYTNTAITSSSQQRAVYPAPANTDLLTRQYDRMLPYLSRDHLCIYSAMSRLTSVEITMIRIFKRIKPIPKLRIKKNSNKTNLQ